jgi:hypothetical protein
MHCRGAEHASAEEARAELPLLKQRHKAALANPVHHAVARNKLSGCKRKSACDTSKGVLLSLATSHNALHQVRN